MSGTTSDEDTASVKNTEKEEWGDDVSILSRYEGSSPAVIIFKFFLALLLIGACSGALVYSIINSEEEVKNTNVYEPPEDFPIDNSQECSMGILSMVYRVTGDQGATIGYTYENVSINWYQDSSKNKIYHRVGVEDKNWRYTYYIFETVSFYYNKTGCIQLPMGYNDFIEGLGLSYVRKLKTEEIIISGKYTETAVYEGEPPSDVQMNGEHPSLIRGYAAMTEPVVYGWEQYFAHMPNTNYSIYKQEYFFPTMAEMSDFAVFEDLPPECMQ